MEIKATKEIKSCINKIKYREERIAEMYREIHDFAQEVEYYMGSATELVNRNGILATKDKHSGILPISKDSFSAAIDYCYQAIIDNKQSQIDSYTEKIKELQEEVRETESEIEKAGKINELQRRNLNVYKQKYKELFQTAHHETKLKMYLVCAVIVIVILACGLFFNATLLENTMVMLFAIVSVIATIFVFGEHSTISEFQKRLDELNEREYVFEREKNKAKKLFEQEKQQHQEIIQKTVQKVNERTKVLRDLKETYEWIRKQNQQFQEVETTRKEYILKLQNQIKLLQKDNLTTQQQAESELHRLQVVIDELQNEKQLKPIGQNDENEQSNLKNVTVKLEREKQTLIQESTRLKSRIEVLIGDLQLAKEENQQLVAENNSKEIFNKELKTQCDDYKSQIFDLQDEIKDKNGDIKYLQKENEELNNEIQRLHDSSDSMEQEEYISLHKYQELSISFESSKRERDVFYRKCNQLQNENEQLQKKYDTLNKKYDELDYQYRKLDSLTGQQLIHKILQSGDLENDFQMDTIEEIAQLDSIPEIDTFDDTQQNYEIVDKLVKKQTYTKDELKKLFKPYNMFVESGIDHINSWTDEVFGDYLIMAEGTSFTIDPDIAQKIRTRK